MHKHEGFCEHPNAHRGYAHKEKTKTASKTKSAFPLHPDNRDGEYHQKNPGQNDAGVEDRSNG